MEEKDERITVYTQKNQGVASARNKGINMAHANLAEDGVREDATTAIPKIDLAAWMKKNKLSRLEIVRRANISASTVSKAAKGEAVSVTKAEAIAAVMGRKVTEIFKIQRDMTPLSNKTVLEYHRFISSVLSQAEKEMLIPFNPAAKATPPKQTKKILTITSRKNLMPFLMP